MKKKNELLSSIIIVLLIGSIFSCNLFSKSSLSVKYSNNSTNKIENLSQWQKNATEVLQDSYPFIVKKFGLEKKDIKINLVIDDISDYTKIIRENGVKKIVVSEEHIRKNKVDSYTGLAYHLATYFLDEFEKDDSFFWLYSGISSYIRCYTENGKYRFFRIPPIYSFKKKYTDDISLAYLIKLKRKRYFKANYYRSGFFLKWIEEKYYSKVISDIVTKKIKTKKEINLFFKKNTGKNIKKLWKEYAMDNGNIELDSNKIVFFNESEKDVPQLKIIQKKIKRSIEIYYDAIVKFFNNPNLPKLIILIYIKDNVNVPAYAIKSASKIVLSSDWIIKRPDDILGVLLHEFVHLVQNSNGTKNNYGYLIEGIADYVRCFLLDGKYKASWVPEYKTFKNSQIKDDKMITSFKKQIKSQKKYKTGYVRTAFYFKWIEDNYFKNFTSDLNKEIKEKDFDFDTFCLAKTKKTADQLWEMLVKEVNKL